MTIRSKKEFASLQEGGRLLADILSRVAALVKPGITTRALDDAAERLIRQSGGTPSFKGYQPAGMKYPYPASLCTSVNEEVVHATPSDRQLTEGAIIGLDIGMKYKGLFTDTAVTVGVGSINSKLQKLLSVTKTALERGIQAAIAGNRVGDIGAAIETHIRPYGYGIVRELVGHGVGKAVHEDPQVPNFGEPHSGEKLVEGMVLALEPMITLGSERVKLARDGWAWVTEDKQPAAHFEHTIIVSRERPLVITAAPILF